MSPITEAAPQPQAIEGAPLVPVNADVGAVEVIMLSEVDQAVNPGGVKDIGELGNVGTNAAVANAIFHATDVCLRTLPIRIDDLLASTPPS